MLQVNSRVLATLAAAFVLLTPAAGFSLATGGSSRQGSPEASFTMRSVAGAIYGTVTELVYQDIGTTTPYKVSELDWPLRPAYFGGINFGFRLRAGLATNIALRAAAPTFVGHMTDSDYLNDDGVKTNFSQQDAYLDRYVSAEAKVGWRISLFPGLGLEPFAMYRILNVKWTAQDGYYQYPSQSSAPYTPWSADETKYYFHGPVMLYEQTWQIPAIGISARYRLTNQLTVGISAAFSLFAWMNDIDNHLLKSETFYDSVTSCRYLEPAAIATFAPNKDCVISLLVDYLSIVSPSNGSILVQYDTNGSTSSTAATALVSDAYSGARMQTIRATLGFEISR